MRARFTAPPQGRRSERGAALLIVIVAVAILTALAVDVAYETRVSLEISANARDELRATYLAKSGVALSRLVLDFQQRIDDAGAGAAGLGALAGRGGGAAASAAVPAVPRPQIWSVVPVSSGLVQALFGGAPAAPADAATEDDAGAEAPAPGAAKAAFGDFEGAFDAKIEDEGRKVNAQLDGLGGLVATKVQGLYQLVCDPKWDPLFDRDDVNGHRVARQDLLVHLVDWVDDNPQSSALAASFPGPVCLMELRAGSPFEAGFADENFVYDRGEDRYKAKNSRLDSLDELYLVAGVSDAFMAAFGDQLTVYLPREAGRNVNTRDARELLSLVAAIATPAGRSALTTDPTIIERLAKAISDQTLNGLLAPTTLQVTTLVQELGVEINPLIRESFAPTSPNYNKILTDRSTVFRIRSAGSAGAVTKTIDAVVTYDPTQNAPAAQQTQPAAALPPGQKASRLIRWREE